MTEHAQDTSYHAVAKTLHWLIAAIIIGLLVVGWIMAGMQGSPQKFFLVQMHKSFGIMVLLLSVLRLMWRLAHPAPVLSALTPAWEKNVALLTHVLFYVLMIGMPMTGWAMVSSSTLNIPTLLFGAIPWPNLPILPDLPNKKAMGHLFREVHGYFAYLIVGLLALHVGAALKHHFVARDNVLLRMAPNAAGRFLDQIRRRP